MTAQRFAAFKLFLVPNFDRVVAQAAYDLLIVVLQAVDALAVLRTTHDFLFHTFTLSPVLVHLLSNIKYFIKLSRQNISLFNFFFEIFVIFF